jgi:hypothetical protein
MEVALERRNRRVQMEKGSSIYSKQGTKRKTIMGEPAFAETAWSIMKRTRIHAQGGRGNCDLPIDEWT